MADSSTPDEEQKKAAEKEAKRVRLRNRSIQELVETERAYVRDLKVLTEVYIMPLTPSKQMTILNPEQHRLLFNNIPSLISLNTNFLTALEALYKEWDPTSTKIADEFLQFAPFFNMYQSYLNSHEQAAGLVSKLYIRSSKFKTFVDAAQFDAKCNGLDIKSYLVKPLQRITKYSLLLRELTKHTLPLHPDYEDLQLAMVKITAVNASINENMKTFDQRQKVRDIAARFTTNVDLVSPARYFIKEGKLTKICRKKDIEYIFILFSDLLIYGEKASDTSKDYQVKIHQQIPINQSFRIRDIPQNIKYGAKCWEIHSPEKSFIVYAAHPGLKHDWLQEMEKVVQQRKTIETARVRPSPLWVPDDFTNVCMMPQCEHRFTVINRRHHCRFCGRLVCGPCSSNKLRHWNKSKKTVRVCTMCYGENKEYERSGGGETKQTGDENKFDDVDSLSVGSEIDFEMWDSVDDEEVELDLMLDDMKQSPAPQDSPIKRSSTKRSKKPNSKRKDNAESKILGPEIEAQRNTATIRSIFSEPAKIFRLKIEHQSKKSTRSFLPELTDLPKRTSYNYDVFTSPMNSAPTIPVMGTSASADNQNFNKDNNDAEDMMVRHASEPRSTVSNGATAAAVTTTAENTQPQQQQQQQHASKASNMSLSTSLAPIVTNHSLNGTNVSFSGLSSLAGGNITPNSSKRLKLVGRGDLDLEVHPSDHELLSLRFHTFTEVIDWDLVPHSMKPKRKKDDSSIFVKALNVLTQKNEILLIYIKKSESCDELMTLLDALKFYYESELADRDDEDEDSEADAEDGDGECKLEVRDEQQQEKNEIQRAVAFIEHCQRSEHIAPVHIARFLLAKSCPLSVIKQAFDLTKIAMPEQEIVQLINDAKSNNKKNGGKKSSTKNGAHAIPLKQSESDEAEDPMSDLWFPTHFDALPRVDDDARWQEALRTHDVRFASVPRERVMSAPTFTLPSDKLDNALRVILNTFVERSNPIIQQHHHEEQRNSIKKKKNIVGSIFGSNKSK